MTSLLDHFFYFKGLSKRSFDGSAKRIQLVERASLMYARSESSWFERSSLLEVTKQNPVCINEKLRLMQEENSKV